MGTRFTPEQFGNAERAGAPRKESSFGNKRAWRDYQERWFKALKSDALSYYPVGSSPSGLRILSLSIMKPDWISERGFSGLSFLQTTP